MTTSAAVLGDCANTGCMGRKGRSGKTFVILPIQPVAPMQPIPPTLPILPSLLAHHVVLEVARGVGLGPQPDLAFDRRLQDRVVRRNEIRIWRRAAPSRCGHAAERVLERELA